MAENNTEQIAEVLSEAHRALDLCFEVGGWAGLAAAVLTTARLDKRLLALTDDNYCYTRWRTGGRPGNPRAIREAVARGLDAFFSSPACELLCAAAGVDVEAYLAHVQSERE